ncbi:pro-kumamolisin, activation domain-containing protein [Trichoderma breve]|uniref:Pro-kumamolisin, activation domain-containing protein n=1 Tax=Trichoderma breve TaxID=2034170 RepID=A0A9W9E3D1_9HYPO|nr:pro-kumamolisin, activation domain-containing protein [Trichoderma breve]KAJ4856549.1 pro-kumamolisin, activation domain-containing protein [Trichoderma breve]
MAVRLTVISTIIAHILVLEAMGAAIDSLSSNKSAQSSKASLTKREIPDSHRLHERQNSHWEGQWEKQIRVPANSLLPMRIGLVQSNIDEGARRLQKISNPNSPDYGKHMSPEEVIEMFAPSETAFDAVRDWLVSAGFADEAISLSANKQWIQLDSRAEDAENVLFAEFFEYEHLASGSKTVAVEEYYVPLHLREYIDYITPGIKLQAHPNKLKKLMQRQVQELQEKPMSRSAHKNVPYINDEDGRDLTIACIRAQYGIPNNTVAIPGNELGIFGGLDEHYSKADLDTFFATLHPHIPNGTYPEERLIDGAIGSVEDVPGYNQSVAGVEADMDIEAAWPLIWPQGVVLFQTDDQFYEVSQKAPDTPYHGFWNTFFDAIDGSYCTYSAYNETGDCTRPECLDPSGGEADLPASYLRRQCNEIMKLALQGVTVVESSGDYGVASYPENLFTNNGCAGTDGKVFYPSADSSTSYSGGGFSNYFDAPECYENPGVNFSDVGDGVYRAGGRGYPDVSAIGERLVAFKRGRWGHVGGTSLSAPIWAAVITLINERRLAANKSTVGFIHPVLYAHTEVFVDITEGSNPGCNTTGFPAVKGWDPVSGLGTPYFPKLVDLFLSL